MASLSSSSTSQSYYLRFSSHSAALSRSLLSLLSESYCTDVHISTGHQSQTIRAHKIILSAFSPYFKSLFSSLPNNQFPVIIIRDINYDILRTIIEFCYRGIYEIYFYIFFSVIFSYFCYIFVIFFVEINCVSSFTVFLICFSLLLTFFCAFV